MKTKMPENDADADADVQGVLRAELGDLQTEIGRIYNILTHTGNLIAENNGILPARLRNKAVEHDGTDCLLRADHRITFFLQTTDSIHGVVEMFPCHTVFRSQGRLMYFSGRGYSTYSA